MFVKLSLVNFLILVLNNSHVLSCDVPTFNSVTVEVKNFLRSLDERATISGCISQQKIAEKVKLDGKLVTSIAISDENVPILYKDAIKDLPDVTTIEINKCKIKEIRSYAFTNLPKLSSLYITHNEIEEIGSDVFKNLPVQVLVLSNNQIEFMRTAIFASLPRLFSLSLDHNHLDSFKPEWFHEDQPILTDLRMASNTIQTLKREAFIKLKKLQVLDLRNNHIRYVHEDTFLGLDDLESLDLSFNRIQRLEENIFKPLRHIQELWLFGNNITYISQKTLKDVDNVERITIHTNPWQCGCYDRIMRWAERNPVYVVDGLECFSGDNPVCVVPSTDPEDCLEERNENLDKKYYDTYELEKDLCHE